MKKYKLIKEYPGSPKLGTISYYDNCCVFEYDNERLYFTEIINYLKYPEFWEEIIEKNYEILSFIVDSNKAILTRRQNNLFTAVTSHVTNGVYSEEDILSNDPKRVDWEEDSDDKYGYSIHSIRRLSDDKVFTVGDKIDDKYLKNIKIVANTLEFALVYDISINHNRSTIFYQRLENTIKNEVLFTTEDGVDIYEGDEYTIVRKGTVSNNLCTFTYTAIKNNGIWSDRADKSFKLFSTKESAIEYINLHKKQFSFNDIEKYLTAEGLEKLSK